MPLIITKMQVWRKITQTGKSVRNTLIFTKNAKRKRYKYANFCVLKSSNC